MLAYRVDISKSTVWKCVVTRRFTTTAILNGNLEEKKLKEKENIGELLGEKRFTKIMTRENRVQTVFI